MGGEKHRALGTKGGGGDNAVQRTAISLRLIGFQTYLASLPPDEDLRKAGSVNHEIHCGQMGG